ncbi:hypothetical protein ACNO8X_08245 [Mycobacterium sp. PDNC021]|uniref:hypothetical protein n=1 Tax=Mycobacterium sp. PDNC021 TaxID=3391399 RepID=UPI003AAD56B7
MWARHWSAIAMGPIARPEVGVLRAALAEFMATDPMNPLCCTLSADGRSWLPVENERRADFLQQAVVSTEPMDMVDVHSYIRRHAPHPDQRIPYKILVGPDSLTCYLAHVVGDAVPHSAFAVSLALGDVDELRYLKPDVGMFTAARLLVSQTRPHYKDWWQYHRAGPRPDTAGPTTIPVPNQLSADGIGLRVSAPSFERFQQWRKDNHPDVPTSALIAAAAYRSLTHNGVPLNPDGFYTVIDLRRYLPAKNALRPGNLAKSIYIPADMTDPRSIAAGIRSAVDSARGIPALAQGGLIAVLRDRKWQQHPTEISKITMSFNLMMRNPGLNHIPWLDPDAARYTVMTYPTSPTNLTVAACGSNGTIEFAVSFVPELVSKAALRQSLTELSDLTAVLSSGPAACRPSNGDQCAGHPTSGMVH